MNPRKTLGSDVEFEKIASRSPGFYGADPQLSKVPPVSDSLQCPAQGPVVKAPERPDVLDAALFRPGRFDRQVTIDGSDVHGNKMYRSRLSLPEKNTEVLPRVCPRLAHGVRMGVRVCEPRMAQFLHVLAICA